MERDAPAPIEVLPPIDWPTARKVGLYGLGMCGGAAILGLIATAIGEPPSVMHTVRLILVFIGAIASGIAVSWRPDRVQIWLIGAGSALLATCGTPAHWDSFQLLFGVLTVVALLRALLAVATVRWRYGLISAFILLHFFGILLATTVAPPTTWMVDQVYRRVYEPYLQFVYLRNAYHFYSPDPGPASIMVCLLKTEDGEETGADGIARKKYRLEWLVTPRRPEDVKDPLGVTYYRRLSLTELGIAHGAPDLSDSPEKSEIRRRRMNLAIPGNNPYIPMHPNVPDINEYILPSQQVSRYHLPSYAQHILMELPEKDRTKTTVKIYRMEHKTLNVGAFIGLMNPGGKPGDPYYPTTYYPYFLGEFGFVPDPTDANKPWRVELLDPQAPMLYWLVPIIERPGGVPGDPKKDYLDFLSIHAGREFDWSKLR